MSHLITKMLLLFRERGLERTNNQEGLNKCSKEVVSSAIQYHESTGFKEIIRSGKNKKDRQALIVSELITCDISLLEVRLTLK